MKKGLFIVAYVLVLCWKPIFAMEAFEQGDQREIGRICARGIHQFQKSPEVVEKFIILNSCLGDCFWSAISDGSYEQAFKAVIPYLGRIGKEGASAEDTESKVQGEMDAAEFSLRNMGLAVSGEGASKEPSGILDGIHRNPSLGEMRRRIEPIWSRLESLPNMMDVHVLDGYVGANMKNVVEVGRTLKIGNPDLSFDHVQASMKRYFQENPITLQLNGTVLLQSTFLGYIDAVFQADFKMQGLLFQELVSRSWSFAIQMRDEKHHRTGKFEDGFLTEIASGIVENYVTGGGCLAGRINRFFAAYVRMIYNATHLAQ